MIRLKTLTSNYNFYCNVVNQNNLKHFYCKNVLNYFDLPRYNKNYKNKNKIINLFKYKKFKRIILINFLKKTFNLNKNKKFNKFFIFIYKYYSQINHFSKNLMIFKFYFKNVYLFNRFINFDKILNYKILSKLINRLNKYTFLKQNKTILNKRNLYYNSLKLFYINKKLFPIFLNYSRLFYNKTYYNKINKNKAKFQKNKNKNKYNKINVQ